MKMNKCTRFTKKERKAWFDKTWLLGEIKPI